MGKPQRIEFEGAYYHVMSRDKGVRLFFVYQNFFAEAILSFFNSFGIWMGFVVSIKRVQFAENEPSLSAPFSHKL